MPSCAFRAATTPGTRWSSATRSTSSALLPSGIVRGTLSVIGNGVVLDPWRFRDEVAKLAGQGVDDHAETCARRRNAPLILPIHRDLDGLREDAAGAGKIGTTGAASARPMRTRSAAARSASAIWPISTSWNRSSTASAPITTRCAPGSASRRSIAPA
jgi:hypothetical protein